MRLVPLDDLPPSQVRRVREVYEANFPPALRAPFADLLADSALAYVGDGASGDTDGEVGGFLVVRAMPSTGWLFLRYFVAAEHGRGLGSAMWAALCAAYPDTLRIVLDVEDPDEPGIDAPEVHERRRRIAFYERLGVRLLPVEGYLPPHDGVPQALRILAYDNQTPSTASPESPELKGADVRAIVVATYGDRYGLAADDPLVRETLRRSRL